MTLFSAVRGLWWVASEVVDAARQLVEFRPGQDDYRAHLADVLAEREAGEEVTEPQGGEGLAALRARLEELSEAQDDCGMGGGDAELPTLVRFWVDGYQSDPITAFVDDWDDGRFTITAAHPFSAVVRSKISQAPLTVYSTDELEWVVDTVTTDRTAYGPEYTVTCKPRMDVLRKSLISDDYLCWLWLDAEKRHAEGASAAPGVSPVEAADKDPGAHPPTRAPGSQTSAGTADDHPFWLPRGELAKALRDAHNAYSRATWDEKFYEVLADAAINFFGQDLASVHARTMRQRQGEDRE